MVASLFGYISHFPTLPRFGVMLNGIMKYFLLAYFLYSFKIETFSLPITTKTCPEASDKSSFVVASDYT